MDEFLYRNAGFLTKGLELLTATIGLILYSKYKHTNTKYFIFFLCYVFILELIGGYTVYAHKYEALTGFKTFIQNNWLRRNNWYYCIFWTIGSTLFYSFYFSKNLVNNQVKYFLKILTLGFLLYSILAIINNWEAFFITRIKGIGIFSTLLIAFSICSYLIKILKSEKILVFHKTMNVYICIAVLLWTIITAPLVFFTEYFNVSDWDFVYLKTNIFFFSNVLLYLTFTIGLIVSKPDKKIK